MRKIRRSLFVVLMFVLTCSMMGSYFPTYAEPNASVEIDPDSPFRNGEFVGIWIGAADNLEEAKSQAEEAAAHVGVVQIFLTSDWSNLNPDPWYVLTAGIYASRSEAEMMLPEIQKYDPEAYIKASGARIGHFSQGMKDPSESSGTPAPSGWLGTWRTDLGAIVEVTQVTDTAVYLIYHGEYEDGSGTFETPYIMPYLNQEKTIAAEPQDVLDKAGWRYEFELLGDRMIMRSRYPDRVYYRVKTSDQTGAQAGTSAGKPNAFYGIWCMASQDISSAQNYAKTLRSKGLSAGVYRAADWSNLNKGAGYVVSAGAYSTQEAAENALSTVKGSCPEAYVKYSGDYVGK